MARVPNEHNEAHANDPKVGDVWHEMLCMVIVVVARPSKKHVIICTAKTYHPGDTWSWDLDKLELLTIDAFSKKIRYDGDNPASGYWCDCRPEAHKWVADAIDEVPSSLG